MKSQIGIRQQFTGFHMLCIMVAFFATIIAVNVTMATLAGSSWSGLVVKNSYVAGQGFNRRLQESRAQRALALRGTLTARDGEIAYGLVDAQGKPVKATAVRAVFRHPVYETADWSIDLKAGDGERFSGRHDLRDGVWIVTIESDIGLARPYIEVRRVTIRDGGIL
ncbi:FixH family protein [Rhizobium herbae]|jgi:nitrogen fixation protein FixH